MHHCQLYFVQILRVEYGQNDEKTGRREKGKGIVIINFRAPRGNFPYLCPLPLLLLLNSILDTLIELAFASSDQREVLRV